MPAGAAAYRSRNASSSPSSAGCSFGLSAFVPVALQPGVGLPERHSVLVLAALGAEVARRGRRELLLARAVPDAVGPVVQAGPPLPAGAGAGAGDAGGGQREGRRGAARAL